MQMCYYYEYVIIFLLTETEKIITATCSNLRPFYARSSVDISR